MMGLSGCGGRSSEGIVVALQPNKEPDAMLEEATALDRYLEGILGVRVEVIIPTSGAVIEQGLANGTVDVAFVSGTSAARFRSGGSGEVMLAVELDGALSYLSYWVGLAGGTETRVEQLRGRAVCFASPTSTSGYIIPAHDLHLRGLLPAGQPLESYFGDGNVQFGTGYVSAVERLLNGQVVAAAVSDYVLEKDKHLSLEEKSRLRVIQSQGPVPTHVLFAAGGLAGERMETVREAFIMLSELEPDLCERIFGDRLVVVDPDEHLGTITAALAFVEQL